MDWATAAWRGAVIVVYFAITTLWLPDVVLGFFADAARPVRDLVALIIWGAALGAGMYLLRRFQRQGLI